MRTSHGEKQNRLRIRALKELMFQRIDALEAKTDATAVENVIKQAAQNEWRDQYGDLTAMFARREYLDAEIRTLRAEIEPLKLAKAMLEGKASASTATGALVLAVLGLLVSAAAVAVAMTRPA